MTGSDAYEVFDIASGVTANISGITIEHGYAGYTGNGGGVVNYGALTLNNDVLTNNSAATGVGGGILTIRLNHDTFQVARCPQTQPHREVAFTTMRRSRSPIAPLLTTAVLTLVAGF